MVDDVQQVDTYVNMLKDSTVTVLGPRFKNPRQPADVIIGGIATYEFDELLLTEAAARGLIVFGPSGLPLQYIPPDFYQKNLLLK